MPFLSYAGFRNKSDRNTSSFCNTLLLAWEFHLSDDPLSCTLDRILHENGCSGLENAYF